MWTFLASNWALHKHYNNSTEHCSLPSILQPPKHPSASQTSCRLQTAAFNLQTEAWRLQTVKPAAPAMWLQLAVWVEAGSGGRSQEPGGLSTFHPSLVKSLLEWARGRRVTLSGTHFECLHSTPVLWNHSWMEKEGGWHWVTVTLRHDGVYIPTSLAQSLLKWKWWHSVTLT